MLSLSVHETKCPILFLLRCCENFWSLVSLRFCHHGGRKKGSDERRNPYLNALSHTVYPKCAKAFTHAQENRSWPAIQIKPEFIYHSKQYSQKNSSGYFVLGYFFFFFTPRDLENWEGVRSTCCCVSVLQ